MFIALIGTPCSGKNTIVQYLVEKHGFKRVRINGGSPNDRHTPQAAAMLDDMDHLEIKEAAAGSSHELSFPDPVTLFNHATRNWQTNYVTTSLHSAEIIEPFVKRPFFLLVGVDGPIGMRYKRERRRHQQKGSDFDLESFINQHDRLFASTPSYQTAKPNSLSPTPLSRGNSSTSIAKQLDGVQGQSTSSLKDALAFAQLHIMNDYATTEGLYAYLDELNLLNGERLRPGWDTYFMTLASLASLRSNCMKRRVGALLVRSKRILATGYNGTPRGLTNCNEGGCARCNGEAKGGEALDECLCLHAEENALLEAGRERVGEDAVLYCNTCPCLRCSVKIVQTGVREVVYNLNYSMDADSAKVLREGGVSLRQLVMPHTMT